MKIPRYVLSVADFCDGIFRPIHPKNFLFAALQIAASAAPMAFLFKNANSVKAAAVK